MEIHPHFYICYSECTLTRDYNPTQDENNLLLKISMYLLPAISF